MNDNVPIPTSMSALNEAQALSKRVQDRILEEDGAVMSQAYRVSYSIPMGFYVIFSEEEAYEKLRSGITKEEATKLFYDNRDKVREFVQKYTKEKKK